VLGGGEAGGGALEGCGRQGAVSARVQGGEAGR